MERTDFDASYSMLSISDILKEKSTRKTKIFLETFTCDRNPDLTDFLHNKAIAFEKHFRTKTYIYVCNRTKLVAAYFSISLQTLFTDNIIEEIILLLDGYKNDIKSIPCYLIGQLGKSDAARAIDGSFILDDACQIINKCQTKLGGRFILLDAVNIPKVIKFYEENKFMKIEEIEQQESIKMIRPYFNISS